MINREQGTVIRVDPDRGVVTPRKEESETLSATAVIKWSAPAGVRKRTDERNNGANSDAKIPTSKFL
jgi:hypothetical protein